MQSRITRSCLSKLKQTKFSQNSSLIFSSKLLPLNNNKSIFSVTNTPLFSFSNTNSQQFMSEIDEIIDIGDDQPKKKVGQLLICPTPIGNLRDISIRQYETLLESDIIACEDTRITGKLFKMFKEKRIKEKFYENFDIEVNEIKDITTDDFEKNDEEDFFDNVGESDFIKKAKKILNELDTLAFLGKKEQQLDDDELYGLEDQFILAMKKKIAEVREKKGRGLMISYYKHNEDLRITKLIKCLQYNFKVALVSDAGTPTISDPGYKLINEAYKQNILVESLPGPNAVAVGLCASGFPSENFVFEGYVSKTPSLKEAKLEKVKEKGVTCVLFESKARVLRTLLTLGKIFGEKQQVFVALELTKLHETHLRGTIKDVYEALQIEEKHRHLKGEITMVIAPYSPAYNEGIEEEKKEQRNVEEENLEFEIDPDHLAKVLNKKLEARDNDLTLLLTEMLGIKKNKAKAYVSRTKHVKDRHPDDMFGGRVQRDKDGKIIQTDVREYYLKKKGFL